MPCCLAYVRACKFLWFGCPFDIISEHLSLPINCLIVANDISVWTDIGCQYLTLFLFWMPQSTLQLFDMVWVNHPMHHVALHGTHVYSAMENCYYHSYHGFKFLNEVPNALMFAGRSVCALYIPAFDDSIYKYNLSEFKHTLSISHIATFLVRKNSCHNHTYTFLIQYVWTRIAQKVKGIAIGQFNFPQKEELLFGVPPSSYLISTGGSFAHLRAD
jgi:hypothetical protein